MTSGDTDELLQFHVSSAPYARSGELEAFREAYARRLLRFDIEPLHDHAVQFDFVLRSLPDLSIASGWRSPMRLRRPNEPNEDEYLFLVVVTSGAAELGQPGRVAAIGDGAATVMSANGKSTSFVVPTPSHTISLRFRRDLLRLHLPNLDDRLFRPIAAGSQVLRLLTAYSGVLNDASALATAELRRAVSGHMYDLATLLLGGKAGANGADGVRAARLKALKDDILQRITRSSLSVDEIARSQQISERYIRELFAGDGTTFTDFVREARLARAHRALRSPAQRHRSIQLIAYESGFGDLSYFNRVFRRRYGMTPSEARAKKR